ncbi:MAG: ABC transporter permease [Clostridia bacterium]|nr:ABC transporter permease [Clostridia bacterium]
MRDFFRRTGVLTKRNLKEIARDPLSLIFMIALPLIMEVMFYYIFHDLTEQFAINVLAPGIVVFSQSFLTLFTGLLISVDRSTSFLKRLYVSKARSHEFIFGYLFALLPISVLQSVLFFVVGGLIDSSFWSFKMILGIAGGVMSSLLFIGLGILFGSLCNEKSIGGVSSIIITGQSVLSGMWFPTEGMSEGFLTVMKIMPFKNATMLVSNLVNGFENVLPDVIFPLIIVAAYTFVAFAAAIAVFKRKMKSK